ncbi:hypothetical protein A2U01_0024062, partial [Trifolium medium]|nr:hypothetical protein [Trifolium medium]
LHRPKVEQKIDIKKKELPEVNKKIVKQEYVAKTIALSEVLKVDNEESTTDDIVTPTANSSVAGRHKEVPAENEIEVQNLVSQETHAEPVQQLYVENNKGSRLEIATSVLNIETEPQMEELFHKGAFSMTLKDVNDETAQGNLHSDDPVWQLIDEQVEVSSNDDGEDILMVPATQLISAKKR